MKKNFLRWRYYIYHYFLIQGLYISIKKNPKTVTPDLNTIKN